MIRIQILSTVLHLAEQQSFWRDSDVREQNSFWKVVFRLAATPTKDGQRVYTTDVVAENVEFAESKNASGGGDNSGFNPSDRPSPSSAAGDGFMNIPDGIDEELPFN